MHSIIYFYLVLIVVFTLYSHARITCEARTFKEDSSKTASKNSTKTGRNAVFTVRMGTDGASQKCQCVLFQLCDKENVYQVQAGESNVKCDVNEACCIQQLDSEVTSPAPAYERPIFIPVTSKVSSSRYTTTAAVESSTNSNTDVCVLASRCNTTALAALYGLDILTSRIDFSDCAKGEIMCPADKVLSETGGVSSTSPSSLPDTEDKCYCISPIYCSADFGENILKERMRTCTVGEICCPEDLIISPDPVLPTPTTNECGIRKGNSLDVRLSGGSSVTFGEFPWMVLIVEKKNNKEEVLCGASLVSSTLVLTAAHCVFEKNVNSLIVRAGEHDLRLSSDQEEMPHQDRSIRNITIHNNYINKLLIHDLALLIVNSPFDYASNVAPICFPLIRSPYSPVDVDMYDFDHCVATGWGIKSNPDSRKPITLSKIDLKLVPTKQCLEALRKSALGPKFVLHPSLLCAIGAPGTDTCKGDGGGPLICPLKENAKKYVQVGVIAGGLECGAPFPSLYASLLQSNSNWITEEISILSVFNKLL